MAYSTVQRVALASGLVLAVSLLLPKAFLSRGKRQEPPPAPGGKEAPASSPGASRPASPLPRGGVGLEAPVPTRISVKRAGEGRCGGAFGRCQAPRFPWHRQWAAAQLPGALSLRTFKGLECALTRPALSGPHTPHSSPSLPGSALLSQVLCVRRASPWGPSLGLGCAFCCAFIYSEVSWSWWW